MTVVKCCQNMYSLLYTVCLTLQNFIMSNATASNLNSVEITKCQSTYCSYEVPSYSKENQAKVTSENLNDYRKYCTL